MSGKTGKRYLICLLLLSAVCMLPAVSARDRVVNHAATKSEGPKPTASSTHRKRPGDGVREEESADFPLVVKWERDGRAVIQHEGDTTRPSEDEVR